VSIGIGYNSAREIPASYFYVAYPFLLRVCGYKVTASGLAERSASTTWRLRVSSARKPRVAGFNSTWRSCRMLRMAESRYQPQDRRTDAGNPSALLPRPAVLHITGSASTSL
jgi:hypothetical protein